MIDCYASAPHLAAHLWPVAQAIPGARLTSEPPRGASRPVLVASARDAGSVLNRFPSTRLGLLEHGAGQTYLDCPDDPHYAGGTAPFPSSRHSWAEAVLILSPGPHAASRWRAALPSVPVVELGGSPRLDPWALDAANDSTRGAISGRFIQRMERGATPATALRARGDAPIAVAWHWKCRVSPEAGWAWPPWREAIEALAGERPVLGHAHPRAWGAIEPWYRGAGIEATDAFEELLERCWLLICDNSSAMFEWAALGRPVLALSSPRWRRDVEHGLRFWSHVPGLECPSPAELPERVEAALRPRGRAEGLREAAVAEAYGGPWDGRAKERAVEAIEEHLL